MPKKATGVSCLFYVTTMEIEREEVVPRHFEHAELEGLV
jgi:hypothetical protein